MKVRSRNIPVLRGLSVAVTLAVVAVAMLSSCSTTRRIPDGEQLYVGLKKVEIEGYDKEKVRSLTRRSPLRQTMPYSSHLTTAGLSR